MPSWHELCALHKRRWIRGGGGLKSKLRSTTWFASSRGVMLSVFVYCHRIKIKGDNLNLGPTTWLGIRWGGGWVLHRSCWGSKGAGAQEPAWCLDPAAPNDPQPSTALWGGLPLRGQAAVSRRLLTSDPRPSNLFDLFVSAIFSLGPNRPPPLASNLFLSSESLFAFVFVKVLKYFLISQFFFGKPG